MASCDAGLWDSFLPTRPWQKTPQGLMFEKLGGKTRTIVLKHPKVDQKKRTRDILEAFQEHNYQSLTQYALGMMKWEEDLQKQVCPGLNKKKNKKQKIDEVFQGFLGTVSFYVLPMSKAGQGQEESFGQATMVIWIAGGLVNFLNDFRLDRQNSSYSRDTMLELIQTAVLYFCGEAKATGSRIEGMHEESVIQMFFPEGYEDVLKNYAKGLHIVSRVSYCVAVTGQLYQWREAVESWEEKMMRVTEEDLNALVKVDGLGALKFPAT